MLATYFFFKVHKWGDRHMAKLNRHTRIVLAVLLFMQFAFFAHAQSVTPTGNELEFQREHTASQLGININVNRDASMSGVCPFAQSSLKANIQSVTFETPNGEQIPQKVLSGLSGLFSPQGETPLSYICDIRDQANQVLREAGWLATVQIPQQELVNDLRLNVILARLTAVEIVGEPGQYRAMIEKRLDYLKSIYPLNENDAERVLLMLADTPGLSLGLSLSPKQGGLPGDVVGMLRVNFEPYAAFVNTRNFNGHQTGRETLLGRVEFYGLTGFADVTYLGAQTTYDRNEQFVAQLGHEFGFKNNKLRLGLNGTYGIAKPDIVNLPLRSETVALNAELSYSLSRRPNFRADMAIGFDYADQTTNIGVVKLSEDAGRAIYLRADMQKFGKALAQGRTISYGGFAEIRQGVNMLNATEFSSNGFALTDGVSASRPFGNSKALILRAGADASLALNSKFTLNGVVQGQWSNDPLLNYEEFSAGSLTTGRGYDPGAQSGDRAVGASLEAAWEAYNHINYRVDVFGFYDTVKVENLDVGTLEPARSLNSIGGGVRYTLSKGVLAELTYAKPLDRVLPLDEQRPTDRLLFSLTGRFPGLLR